MNKFVKKEILSLELGEGLCSEKEFNIINKIKDLIINNIFNSSGVLVTSISLYKNLSLKPYEYVIKISDVQVASYELKKNSYLILDIKDNKIQGKLTKDPILNLSSVWVSSKKKQEAIENGNKAIIYYDVLKFHLQEIIKTHLSSFITTQYVIELLGDVMAVNSPLCLSLTDKYKKETCSVVKSVLRSLLDDDIRINNIETIFETMADEEYCKSDRLNSLIQKVRHALAPTIVNSLVSDNQLNLIQIDKNFSEYLEDAVNCNFKENEIEDNFKESFKKEFLEIYKKLDSTPVVVCNDDIREILNGFITITCGVNDFKVISDVELAIASQNIDMNKINFNFVGILGKDFVPKEEESKKINNQKDSEKDRDVISDKETFSKVQDALRKVLNKFTLREQKILSMRFGLDEEYSHTLDEVGLFFNMSREEIRKIEVKALRLLRDIDNF